MDLENDLEKIIRKRILDENDWNIFPEVTSTA